VGLPDWQAALGQLVEACAAGREPLPADALDGLALDDAERAWLDAVRRTPGFALTALVPRRWREIRLRRAGQLTLAALGPEAPAWLRDYQRAVPNFTLFVVPEGLAFLDYIAARPAAPHVHAIARFERAMWHARLAADTPPALLSFDAPPDRLLAALVQGAPLPDPDGARHHALVSPALPGLWRPATADEARAFLAGIAA
jgi:hypothetical protein